MITPRTNRLDPSLVPSRELDLLASAFAQPGHLSLIDEQGNRTKIPEPILRQFARITRLMREGSAIVLVPEQEDFTTQAAADYLGMSRQHLVNLLEDARIPFHRVGTRRRVTFKDLLEFESKRDADRRIVLDQAFDGLADAGLYENDYTGDHEGQLTGHPGRVLYSRLCPYPVGSACSPDYVWGLGLNTVKTLFFSVTFMSPEISSSS